MSISSVLVDAVKAVDWIAEAAKGTTDAESIGPLLLKAAVDGFKAAEGKGSLLDVVRDIEALIPTALDAFKANNADQAATTTTADTSTADPVSADPPSAA